MNTKEELIKAVEELQQDMSKVKAAVNKMIDMASKYTGKKKDWFDDE